MSVFVAPPWIEEFLLPSIFFILPIFTLLIFNSILFKTGIGPVYGYIMELNASIIVFVLFLLPGVIVVGPDIFAQTGGFRIHTSGLFLFYIISLLFGSLGLLIANIRFCSAPVISSAKYIAGMLKSTFIPPYESAKIELRSPNQPSLDNKTGVKRSIFTGIVAISCIWTFAASTQHFGEFTVLLEGHLDLIRYIQDVMSGDPEKIVDGWTGGVNSIVSIFNPFLFISYSFIIFFAFSLATSSIFTVRKIIERLRTKLGLSKLGMATISTVFSFPMLVFAYHVMIKLVFYTSATFTFFIHHS